MSGAMSASTMAYMTMGSQALGAFNQARGARAQAQASQDAYNYQAAVSENNAKMAEWQAQDATRRGATAVQQQQLKTASMTGAQRARLAANGVDLGQGSALNILSDTEFLGQQDALTIQDNASREAWGYRVQGANSAGDAALLRTRADAESPNMAMGLSLLTSATQVAPSWYKYYEDSKDTKSSSASSSGKK